MVIGGKLFKKNLKTGCFEMLVSWIGYDLDTIAYFVTYCDCFAERDVECFDIYRAEYFKITDDGYKELTSNKIWEIINGLLSSK